MSYYKASADSPDPDSLLRRRVAGKFLQQFQKDREQEEEAFIKGNETSVPKSPYTIQNVIWIVAAIAVFYFTDLPIAVLYDPRIYRTWLNIGIVLIGANLGIASYLIVYLSWIKKLNSDEWDVRHPAAIPIATACFAFGSICMTVALWPLWGWCTPLILFTELMAVVVVISLLPNCI